MFAAPDRISLLLTLMTKPGIIIDIPGFRQLDIRTLVSDFTGTLSCQGRLSAGVRERIRLLHEWVDIHIISSDSFGTAEEELAGLPLTFKKLLPEDSPHDQAKQTYVEKLEPVHLVAIGNGRNDRLMLQSVKKAGGLAIAVDNGEGCATEAFMNADLLINGAVNALTLLLVQNSCKATLRS
jgi:soluble P-type ATPase